MASACRIDTTFYSPDPEMAGNLIWLNSLPESDPVRHDMLAHLYVVLARASWRAAEDLRRQAADHEKRSAAARRRRQAPANVPGRALPRSRSSRVPAGDPDRPPPDPAVPP